MPSPFPQAPESGDTQQLLAQLLSAIADLREELRTEIHALRAKVDTMVSKDEIQRYLPRETAEGQRQLIDARFNDLSKRLDMTVAKQDEMLTHYHERELAEANDRKDDRKELDGRTIAIMTTMITLILSPIVWAIFNLIQHAILK